MTVIHRCLACSAPLNGKMTSAERPCHQLCPGPRLWCPFGVFKHFQSPHCRVVGLDADSVAGRDRMGVGIGCGYTEGSGVL